jgi:KEOPS complex subunit Pcc1
VTSKKSASTNHDAVLSFDYASAQRARRVERAIRPEAGDIAGDRTEVSLSRDDERLEVRVSAADLTALRAGLNTWFSLVTVAERAGGVAEA